MNRSLLKTVVFAILLSAGIQAQWTQLGFNGRDVQDIAVKDSILYILSHNSFFSSKDNGATWDSLGVFTGTPPQKILLLNDTMFVYAHWQVIAKTSSLAEDKPCVFRSDDRGHTWKTVLSSFIGAGSMTISGRTLFCTIAPKYLLKSTDYGATWDTLTLTSPAPAQVDYLFSYNKKLYASQYNSGLFRSSNDGQNWQDISAALQPLGYYNMFANSKYLYLEKDSILYRSSDDGESWETFEIPLKPGLSVFNALATDSLIFLSGYIRGTTTLSVYAGTVRGNQWKDITAGLPGGTSYQPKALAVKDNWLYFGTGNITNGALWKYDLSHLLAVEDNAAPVKTFSLSQNYPNPFNPSTQISFHLPEGSKVTLRIYDMLGKEAAVLMDEYRSAGTHTVQFNASNLPSGMYIYQLRAGEHTSMRKMMLLK